MTTEQRTRKHLGRVPAIAAAIIVSTAVARAQVPQDVAAELRNIGPVVAPPATAKIYGPLHPRQPYPGVTVLRDASYGPHQRHLLDVFGPATSGGAPRPVLIYFAGGAGNKVDQSPDGEVFYDNIMLWAVKNGMTGVNVQRLGPQGRAWDDPARDIGLALAWVRENIAKYQGNRDRMFVWAHSAANAPVGDYIGHPDLHGPEFAGLKGAILMGGPANINILPARVEAQLTFAGRGDAGRGERGRGAGDPAGRGGAAPGPGPGRGTPVDPATQLARSNLPELTKTNVALFFNAGEIDLAPAIEFVRVVRDELCKAGRCPATAIFKDHSHMSSVYSPNTADDSVTGPILRWMKDVR